MLEDLLHETDAPARASAPRDRDRRSARRGALSLWLLVIAMMLYGISLAQQLSYLFAPRPGELPLVVAVLAAAAVLGLVGVVVGSLAATKPDGRRTGVFGAALGLGLLVLFAAASWFGWGFLSALSAPV